MFVSFDKVMKNHKYHFGNEITVNEFMSNWTTQPGYPVMMIERDESTNEFLVTQVNKTTLLVPNSCISKFVMTIF